MKGFPRTNLKYLRAFAEAWPDLKAILEKLARPRNTLALHIDNRTLERQGKALTNFGLHLPKPQSDLVKESLKGIGVEADYSPRPGSLWN